MDFDTGTQKVSLGRMRAFFDEQVDLTSASAVAAETGVARNTLMRFIEGSNTHRRSLRLLTDHYLRRNSTERLSSALSLLVGPDPELQQEAVTLLSEMYERRGMRVPEGLRGVVIERGGSQRSPLPTPVRP